MCLFHPLMSPLLNLAVTASCSLSLDYHFKFPTLFLLPLIFVYDSLVRIDGVINQTSSAHFSPHLLFWFSSVQRETNLFAHLMIFFILVCSYPCYPYPCSPRLKYLVFQMQMVMAVFSYIYHQSFVVSQSITVESIIDQVRWMSHSFTSLFLEVKSVDNWWYSFILGTNESYIWGATTSFHETWANAARQAVPAIVTSVVLLYMVT